MCREVTTVTGFKNFSFRKEVPDISVELFKKLRDQGRIGTLDLSDAIRVVCREKKMDDAEAGAQLLKYLGT